MQNHPPHLHSRLVLRRRWHNRIFALIYTCNTAALLYHHTTHLLHTTNTTISLLMLLADMVLAFVWLTNQPFKMNPVHRKTFPENLPKDVTKYPAMDVFICTADPYKEPPMAVVNTALSIMAYDYPTEKLSVYLSDDGGSKLTLFAFMEAAKFAKHWLPYCKKNNILDRCPEAHFSNHHTNFSNTSEVKLMYEKMKAKVEETVASGNVYPDEKLSNIFHRWDAKFTRTDHPTVIQVLLDGTIDDDVLGQGMPNLIYVSREKRKVMPHKFKAGALNVLLRVSEIMTNAPIILTMDCDMYSNDPKTPLHALCYFLDPSKESDHIAYVQYPQLFHGINQDDLYGAEFKFIFQINQTGLDGFSGPTHVGTGCFFRRRAFFGSPSSRTYEQSQSQCQSIQSKQVLDRAHEVASSDFEAGTEWGSQLGYRYGSLVEDLYTGYSLQSQGWRSVFNFPKRPAFLGDAPMNLHDLLTQTHRWSIGVLDMAFAKYSPFNHGFNNLPFLQNLCYINYALWCIPCIPVVIYSLLPQLALIHSVPIFPKVSDPWFLIYAFSFAGTYFQEFLDYKLMGGTTRGWFNNQRAWIIRSLSSFTFGITEYALTKVQISSSTFNVTSKVVDGEANTRYEQGMMEFGVESPFFYPISMAAMINLVAFVYGVMQSLKYGGVEDLFVQLFLSGFGVINSWPVYQAMFIRTDRGRMPLKITLRSIAIAWMLYLASPFIF